MTAVQSVTAQQPVGLPRWVYVPAFVGAAFVLLPLVAIVAKVDWANFGTLITSERLTRGVLAEPEDLDGGHAAVRGVRGADGIGAGPP